MAAQVASYALTCDIRLLTGPFSTTMDIASGLPVISFSFSLISLSFACEVPKVDYHIPPGSTEVSNVVERFRPYFSYINACNSYPAVTKDGKMSAGLPGSRHMDDCRETFYEQTYVRAAYYSGTRGNEKAYMAILYAQFAPKDNGHRYDWEDVVVFIDREHRPIKAAGSFHGGYLISRPGSEPRQWNGDRVRAKYTSCICNRAFQFSVHDGADPPIKSWSMMDPEERYAIQNGCWGNGIPKLIDENFKDALDRAWTETKPSLLARLFCKVRCTFITSPIGSPQSPFFMLSRGPSKRR